MRSSGVRRINNAVRRLDWALVENSLSPPDGSDGGPYELCAASRDDWHRYVQSEQQQLKSRSMAWWDDRVFIVELAGSSLHESLVEGVREAISAATGTGRTHLARHGGTYIRDCAHLADNIMDLIGDLEPDEAFGPEFGLPGAVLPPGLTWSSFHTLKVEIGVYRTWGDPVDQQGQAAEQGQQGQARQRRIATLNEKADAWRQCPGVEYVLCIHISPGMRVRQYRLFSIVDEQFEHPDLEPAPIVNGTVVQFDPWRLLGIPPDSALPVGFNDPVQFDLFAVVNQIIQLRQMNLALLQAAVPAAAPAVRAPRTRTRTRTRAHDPDPDPAGQPPRHRQRRH